MKVLFATPTYKGLSYGAFLDSLESTVKLCEQRGIETQFTLVTGCCYVQEARNKMIKQFLDSDADQLFFLDDDISWPAEKAIEFIESSDAIIAGIYPLKCDPLQFPVVIHTDANHLPIVRMDGCIAGHSLPTGFMRIKREVIEKLIAAYPAQKYEVYEEGEKTGEFHDLFPQGVHNGRWVGEDYAFCRLWRDIGGEMWVKPDIDFTHAGFAGNYHNYLLQQPGGKNDR